MNQFARLNKVSIAKLTMQESGTYNPLYYRPYQTYVDGVTLDNIVRRVEQSGSKTINPMLLTGLGSSMVSPSAAPHSEIIIPQGWSERRIRFSMEVIVETGLGVGHYIFQGYTSHLGVTPNGSIDPNMQFIINSFIRFNRGEMYTPQGLQIKDTITESGVIINGDIHYQIGGNNKFLMRPNDIFAGFQSIDYNDDDAYMKSFGGLNDTRVLLTDESVRSNRSNNIPTNYVAKVLDSYNVGIKLSDFGQGREDIYDRCRDLTNEQSVMENPFLRSLANARGIGNGTMFTYSELERVDPNVKHVTNYLSLGPTNIVRLHHTGQTAYWNGADRETVVATILSNSVPAVMMDLFLTGLNFRATNYDSAGRISIIVMGYRSITTADMSANIELFKTRFEKEIIFDLTFGNQELFQLDMNVDLYGETTLTLSLGSNPAVTFATPSFCDSLIAPVVTDNKNDFYNVVNDFKSLVTTVAEISGPTVMPTPLI